MDAVNDTKVAAKLRLRCVSLPIPIALVHQEPDQPAQGHKSHTEKKVVPHLFGYLVPTLAKEITE